MITWNDASKEPDLQTIWASRMLSLEIVVKP